MLVRKMVKIDMTFRCAAAEPSRHAAARATSTVAHASDIEWDDDEEVNLRVCLRVEILEFEVLGTHKRE